ncbi:MAG: Fur family transcriptional regulator [Thermoplasmata archaeon]
MAGTARGISRSSGPPAPGTVASLARSLAEAGLRVSPQRRAVLRALVRLGPGHPSAARIYREARRQKGGISQATVYNTLERLREVGAITELGFPQGPVRFDLNGTPHANLICVGCGRITDVPLGGSGTALDRLGRGRSFAVRSRRVDLYGLCAACQPRRRPADAAAPRQPTTSQTAPAAAKPIPRAISPNRR